MDIVLTSHKNGYEWSSWLDSDDPTNDGDYETMFRFSRNEVCENPIPLDARPGTSGSTEVTHTSGHTASGLIMKNKVKERITL